MVQRIVFILLAAFWVAMNVSLWRAEYGRGSNQGSPVPVSTVWRKVLTAADTSALEVRHQGRRLGFCRWGVNVIPSPKGGDRLLPDPAPEGMIAAVSGYSMDLSGNLVLGASAQRLRFDFDGVVSTNRSLRSFNGRVTVRPGMWELRAGLAEDRLHVSLTDGFDKVEESFSIEEMRDPRALLKRLADPVTAVLLGEALPLDLPTGNNLAAEWNWEARYDWLKLGHTAVRVYRVEARLMDRYKVVLFVSRVGEILRAELPGGVELVNDQLGGF